MRASCLSCHRRKLKCSRDEPACKNCKKNDIGCEYPPAEARTRGKRGPYQKRATKIERDLEQELRATEAKYRELATRLEEKTHDQAPSVTYSHDNVTQPPPSNHGSISTDHSTFVDLPFGTASQETHPPLDQMLQLWHVFVTRVDPMTKVIHRPSFEKRLFLAKGHIHSMDDSMTTLMYSIYYAAVQSTTAAEALLRFGESKNVLTERFEGAMEKRLAMAQISSTPDFTTLQALVLYICTVRRQDGSQQLWPLFGLAVRTAQLLKIGSVDDDLGLSPLEVELRRRVWWMISWLEKRCAEDVAAQPASIMTWSECPFPLNVNDDDLDPAALHFPQPRSGVTDMTFCLLRFEMLKLFFELFNMRPDKSVTGSQQRQNSLDARKDDLLSATKNRLQYLYLQHCSATRPFDWLVMTFAEGFIAKAEIMTRRASMSDEEAFSLSLVVLRNTYLIQTDPRAEAWSWIFREFVQSHALIKVVSELCKGPNSTVSLSSLNEAWTFIERVVSRIPPRRLKDPAVSPIVTLMGLARQHRVDFPASQSTSQHRPEQQSMPSQAPVTISAYNPVEPLQTFPDAWTENAIGWGSSFLNAAIMTPESQTSSDAAASRMNSFAWPTTDAPVAGPPFDNIDWTEWNSSLSVFDTRFAPEFA